MNKLFIRFLCFMDFVFIRFLCFLCLMSGLDSLLRMFCFLCFTSAVSNKLYNTRDEPNSDCLCFEGNFLQPIRSTTVT